MVISHLLNFLLLRSAVLTFQMCSQSTYMSILSDIYQHNTGWKVSVFVAFLVRIFPHLNWIGRDTPYFSVLSPNAGKYGPEKLQTRTLSRSVKLYWLARLYTRPIIKGNKNNRNSSKESFESLEECSTQPSKHLPVQSQEQKHYKRFENCLKSKMTPERRLYC